MSGDGMFWKMCKRGIRTEEYVPVQVDGIRAALSLTVNGARP